MKKEFINKVILRSCNSGSQPYKRQSGRDAEYRHLSMTSLNRGFTLIELLVVVLIIGILSAVALPQYEKAVEKSRATEALNNIKIIKEQMDLYVLENGRPTSLVRFQDLSSVDLTGGVWREDGNMYVTKNFSYWLSCSSPGCTIEVYRDTSGGLWEGLWESFYATTFYNGYSSSPVNGWYQNCITQSSDMGRYICKNVEPLGWEYIEGEL